MRHKNILTLCIILLAGLLISSADAQERWGGRRGGPNPHFERGEHAGPEEGMPGENLDKIFDELDEFEPGIKNLFEELKETDHKNLRKHLRGLAQNKGFRFMGKGKSQDGSSLFAKTLKLELESLKIANQIMTATDESEKKSLKNDLKNKLYDSFEAKTKLRSYHIQRMTEKLKEISSQNQEREIKKDQIVEKRLNELIEEQGNLDW